MRPIGPTNPYVISIKITKTPNKPNIEKLSSPLSSPLHFHHRKIAPRK
jgi:hypothetical protein